MMKVVRIMELIEKIKNKPVDNDEHGKTDKGWQMKMMKMTNDNDENAEYAEHVEHDDNDK